MVLDRVEEQERYYGLHPLMEEAFAFIAEAATLEPGRYELSGGAYANVAEGDTVQLKQGKIEAHKKYIDLQCVVAGSERMAWASVQEVEPITEYDEACDVWFFEGVTTSLTIKPGMFYIMFPADAHKPGCHNEFPKHYKKVIVKLPVEA